MNLLQVFLLHRSSVGSPFAFHGQIEITVIVTIVVTTIAIITLNAIILVIIAIIFQIFGFKSNLLQSIVVSIADLYGIFRRHSSEDVFLTIFKFNSFSSDRDSSLKIIETYSTLIIIGIKKCLTKYRRDYI